MQISQESHTVSIIVPIYNAEKYLECCLQSIITQSYPFLEIICVNDGSTDGSLKIIENFKKKDKRIVLINQENRGLSAARNIGTDKATGNYIMYVDADDFIEVNMVEVLLKNILTYDTDFVIETIWNYDDETQNRVAREDSYFTMSWLSNSFSNRKIEYKELLNKIFALPVMAWGKLYKTEFLRNSGVRFPEGLIYEDNPFFFELLFKSSGFSVDRRQLYNYRVNVKKSITSDAGKNYADMLTIMNMIEKILKQQPFYEQIKDEFLFYRLKHTLRSFVSVNPKFKRDYFNKIQQEFLNIDMLYYNEAVLAKQQYYPLYCSIRNDNYWQYLIKNRIQKVRNFLSSIME